jgi:hypothetical protein
MNDLAALLAEVEALLPDHWTLTLRSSRPHYWASATYGYSLAHYRANVGRARYCPYYYAHAKSAPEALTELAALLREGDRPWEVW